MNRTSDRDRLAQANDRDNDWSNWFFRNPRLLLLVVVLAMVAGLSSAMVMPRMEDPPLKNRAAQITTLFPGAAPERVESLVTEKIEDKLAEIAEIKELRSSSRTGISFISIELRDDVTEVEPVWSRIRDRLGDAQPLLPPGAMESEFDAMELKAFALLVAVRWSGEGQINHSVLRRLSERLEDRLEAVTGTEKVDRFGDVTEELLVELQSDDLAARQLTVAEIAGMLRASDAKVSAGQIRGQQSDLLVEVDSELDTLARIGATPLRFGENGAVTRLADIATVQRTIADPPRSLAVVGGSRSIVLGAYVRPNYRIDQWRAAVESELQAFNRSLPTAIDIKILLDQNDYVATRIGDLLWNLMLGGAAVVFVILLLMGFSSALIVASSLPLAAMFVLFGLRVMDIPIHQMSVTGLIIALGLLIDNAIVMVDEVGERLRERMSRPAAVGHSVKRMAAPLLGSTLTTAFAFGPIALMPGPAGEFVGSIAVSVILAIAASFFLAMTVVPAFAAWGIRPGGKGIISQGIHSKALSRFYQATLAWTFRRPAWGLAIGAALPVLGFIASTQLPEQFFPAADRNQFYIELELGPGSSQQQTLQMATAIRQQMLERADVEDVHWFVGESAPSFYYNLIPRRRGADQYAQAMVQLRPGVDPLPVVRSLQDELDCQYSGARVLVRLLEQGPPFDAPVEIRLFGDDLADLQSAGEEMRRIMSTSDNILHTRAELNESLTQVAIDADEDAARIAGISFESIAQQLQASLDGATGGSVLESTEDMPVRVRLARDSRSSLTKVRDLHLLADNRAAGAQAGAGFQGIPISAVAKTRLEPRISSIAHFNGRRVNEVQAFTVAGMLPSESLLSFQKQWAASGYQLPESVSYEWGGEAAKRDDAVGNLMVNVGVLVVCMAATLVLSFGSFRMAAIIAAVAALAVGLGMGALWLYGFPFGFMAIVGTMGLVGVAINDAIVVLAALRDDKPSDESESNRQASEPANGSGSFAVDGDVAAVVRVVTGATRHIVATSLTTMAGFAPLVLAGGTFWPPLAVAIAGGVGGATLLALYFVPSAYILAMCAAKKCGGAPAATDPQEEPARPRPKFAATIL